MDCAPVEKVEMLSPSTIASILPAPAQAAPGAMAGSMPGSMVVTTMHGSVLVPANFPRRESKDNRMHACMRPGDGGAMRLICIFLPPAM
jgi:anti-sigma factor RsiW